MTENRWTWILVIVWLGFFCISICAIVVFCQNMSVVKMNEYFGKETVFNYYGLIACILTIFGAFISAATISMIESIYKIVAKNNK